MFAHAHSLTLGVTPYTATGMDNYGQLFDVGCPSTAAEVYRPIQRPIYHAVSQC